MFCAVDDLYRGIAGVSVSMRGEVSSSHDSSVEVASRTRRSRNFTMTDALVRSFRARTSEPLVPASPVRTSFPFTCANSLSPLGLFSYHPPGSRRYAKLHFANTRQSRSNEHHRHIAGRIIDTETAGTKPYPMTPSRYGITWTSSSGKWRQINAESAIQCAPRLMVRD